MPRNRTPSPTTFKRPASPHTTLKRPASPHTTFKRPASTHTTLKRPASPHTLKRPASRPHNCIIQRVIGGSCSIALNSRLCLATEHHRLQLLNGQHRLTQH